MGFLCTRPSSSLLDRFHIHLPIPCCSRARAGACRDTTRFATEVSPPVSSRPPIPDVSRMTAFLPRIRLRADQRQQARSLSHPGHRHAVFVTSRPRRRLIDLRTWPPIGHGPFRWHARARREPSPQEDQDAAASHLRELPRLASVRSSGLKPSTTLLRPLDRPYQTL